MRLFGKILRYWRAPPSALESNQRQGMIFCSVIVVSSLGKALRRVRPTPGGAGCSGAAIAQAPLPAKWWMNAPPLRPRCDARCRLALAGIPTSWYHCQATRGPLSLVAPETVKPADVYSLSAPQMVV